MQDLGGELLVVFLELHGVALYVEAVLLNGVTDVAALVDRHGRTHADVARRGPAVLVVAEVLPG